MKRKRLLATLLTGGLLWMASAQGAVITGGQAVFIEPPPSVATGGLTSMENFFVFEERTVTLENDLNVDWLASDGGALSNGDGGTLAAGTRITSYFIHFEPASRSPGGIEMRGELTFPQKIIAVIFSPTNLAYSDPVLGVPGTSYPTGQNGRRYEAGDQQNSKLIDEYTLLINTKTWYNPDEHLMDQARVITAPVPVPAALWLFVSGILAMIGLNRRRKRAAASIAG